MVQFLDKATNETELLQISSKFKAGEVIYTHHTKINYGEYPGLKYVICPCTDISHLNPRPEGVTFIYLANKKMLYDKVVSSAEWVVYNIFRLLKNKGMEQDELRGKVVSFIGYGRMMQRAAKMLYGCEVAMYYYDKNSPMFFDSGAMYKDPGWIYENSDIVIVGLSKNKSTTHFIDFNEFNKMIGKRPYFLNNSRSVIVRGEALLWMVERDYLRGCAIDVFEDYSTVVVQELLRLQEQRNLIITPHIAGKGVQSRRATDNIVLELFKGVIEGAKEE